MESREQQNEKVLVAVNEQLGLLKQMFITDTTLSQAFGSMNTLLLSDISKSLAIIADKVNKENDCLHGGDK